MNSMFTNVPKGRQTVQTYSPSMGVDYELKVSTYNGKSWNVVYCSNARRGLIWILKLVNYLGSKIMNNLFTCSTWHTIDNAPENKAVLTNLGLAIYKPTLRSAVADLNWYLCDSTGYIPYDQYEGIAISKLDMPRIWTEFNPPECP